MILENIADVVMNKMADEKEHSIDEIVDKTLLAMTECHRSEVKSAILGLIRRDRLQLTDSFKIVLTKNLCKPTT